MFTPSTNTVMVELVEKDVDCKLHLPDSAKKNHMLHSLVVYAVGPDVTLYEEGDVVMTPLPKEHQLAQEDMGDGEKVYIFWKEDEIFGKFNNKEK